ncbi:hypothetical protein N3C_1467 [Clostridium sp. N3C]|uniref:hypothetical protein n=1 Tax=Clostridium sp. N3C TaxID=1776758 RepID=UPI00092E014A|nr:hypothetical protein [Clostridium sp. N3C]SCN23735.1 hypothetical protein N3C_1467 [Clostridium sp. N3C]
MKKCRELFRKALKLLGSKKRQITASLMCLVMLLTIVPQGSLTVLTVSSESDLSTESEEDSSSDYSSSSTADHVHQDEISFSKLDGNFTRGELAPGDYYLDSDIPITKTIIISIGTVSLCLNGHTISQECICNNIGFYGGGIFISNGTFTMNGGSISSNSGSEGDGILVSYARFTLNNGTISGNTAKKTGGGIYSSRHTLILNGGNVTANTAGQNGGGVYTDRSFSDFIITVGGSPTITDNMVTTGADNTEVIEENFCIGKPINPANLNKFRISDDFSGKIVVSTTLVPTLDSPTVISVSVKKDYSNYFFSDKDGYEIFNSGSGNNQVLKLIVSHEHEWQESWSSDNSTHWHECSACHERIDEEVHVPETDDGDCSTALNCSVCGAVIIPAHSHHFSGEWLHDENGHWYKCSHSGCTVIDTKEAHVWIEGISSSAPSYFADGQRIDTCEICGKTRTIVLPKLIDNIAPTGKIAIDKNSWNIFFNNLTFGLFFKDTQTVMVTSEDKESDVDKTYYYLSHKELSEAEAKKITAWTEFNGSFSINPNNSYVVYIKITDKAGNSSIINTDGLVLDNIIPAINGVTDGKTYCKAVTVTVTDDNLDTVKVNGETINLIDGTLTLYPADKVQTITAIDKSGNKKSVSIRVSDQHQWDEGLVTLEPTASEKGVKVYTCINCGETKTEEIPMLAPSIINGHNSTWKPEEGGILTFRSNAAF